MWGFDLETTDWDQVRCAVAISDQGDVERWKGPGAVERVAEHQEKTKGTHIAHAGGIFDTLLVSQARQNPWREVIMSGSAVLCAVDKTLKVRDTFRWWLSGLKKVGQYLEQCDDEREARGEVRRAAKGHWLKKDVDRARIEDLTEDECLRYCESDVEILMEGARESLTYLEGHGARRAWTAGASALSLLQVMEPASWGILRRHTLDLDTAIRANECVRGARVECWALGKVEGVYSYDIKSAYPASYANESIPIGARPLHADDDDRDGAVWRCRWYWPDRGLLPPVLDQGTGAGAGWCEGWLVGEEVQALHEAGVKVQRIEGWAPQAMAPIGQRFLRELFAEKEKGSFFAKVFLNSLAGKWAESPIKECWQSYYPDEWYGPKPELVGDYWRFLDVAVDKRGRVACHLQPLAAATILGRTRMRLWRFIHAIMMAGGEVYYCDTDSIHTNLAPEKMPFALGTALGDLAFEGGPCTALYCGPKAYCFVDGDGKAVKGACKGVPWNDLKDGVREGSSFFGNTYRQARGKEKGEDLRAALFVEALREYGGARIKKEGIATWKQGLRLKDGWRKYSVTRTIGPIEHGKVFKRGELPNVWAYRTPAEVHAQRRVTDEDKIESVPNVDDIADVAEQTDLF